MTDIHEKYEKNQERVDVFYGKNRVYVTLRRSREMRKKFADFLKKTKEWIKVEKVPEIPGYAEKR